MGTVQATAFVALSDVAAEHGMPEKTLRRRIRRWNVPLFQDPYDLRKVVMRAEDAAAIFEPRPIRAGGEEAAAA